MKKKFVVNAIKLFILIIVSITTFSLAHYAPAVPPFFKPIVPIKYRWTDKEIVRQIEENRVDKKFLEYFERDPERNIPNEPHIIVSPADGAVKRIRDIENGKRVVIYMSVWDVHIQRVPLSGEILGVQSSFHLDEDDFRCMRCPQNVTRINTEVGMITVKQVTSGLAKRVKTYLNPGQKVETGERLGFIFLGSHTVIDLPPVVNPTVKVGDKVFAGESIIARY
jgi:phosphatidylserine decarboxylase